MTYQEMQERLTKVETLIKAVQQPRYQNTIQNVQETLSKLSTIKENLENKMKILAESEENMFVTTKTGGTKSVSMSTKQAMDLRKDPNVTGIETTKGKALKEGESNVDYDLLVKLILGANNPQKLDIRIEGFRVFTGRTALLKGELTQFFNGRDYGKDATDITNMFVNAKEQPEITKQEVEEISDGKIKVEFEYGYGKQLLLVFQTKFKINKSINEEENKLEVDDKVKIADSHGGGTGKVKEVHDSFVVLTNGKSYHESDLTLIKKANNESIKEGEGDDHHYVKIPRLEFRDANRIVKDYVNTFNKDNKVYDNDEKALDFGINGPATGDDVYTFYFDFDDKYIANGAAEAFIADLTGELSANGVMVIESSVELDENINEEKIKPGTYAGVAVVVHMNGPETEWKVEFIGDSKFGPAGTIVDYVDVIANLKFDDGTKPTDYMKRRDASSDYPQLKEDEMDGGADQGQLDDEDEIFMPMGDPDEDPTPLGYDRKNPVRKEHHDEAGMEVPADDHDDLDIGHQDDEPDMLKQTAFEIAMYGAKLYKQLNKYDKMGGEVDFPNWWQSKVILAKDYISKAQHYLDFEDKQPVIDKLALEGKMKNEIGMFNDPIGYEKSKPETPVFTKKFIRKGEYDILKHGKKLMTFFGSEGEANAYVNKRNKELKGKELKEMKVDKSKPMTDDQKLKIKKDRIKKLKKEKEEATTEGKKKEIQKQIEREELVKKQIENRIIKARDKKVKKTGVDQEVVDMKETKISKKRFKELLAEAYYEVIAEQEAEVNTDDSLKTFFNDYGISDPDKNDPKKKVNPIIALHGSKAAAERDLESEVTINVGAGGESYTFRLKGGQEYDLYKKDGGDQSFWEVQIRGYKHTLDAKGIKDAQQDLRILSKEAPTPSTDDPAGFEDDASGGADAFTGGDGGGADLGGGTGTGGGEADTETPPGDDTETSTVTPGTALNFDTETEV